MAHTGALILAAGKGTRMRSERPKVLHTLLGEPMLWHVYRALEGLVPDSAVWTVVGHGAQQMRAAFPGRTPGFVVQERQLGTGHALQTAWPALDSAGVGTLLVVNGDTPLVPRAALAALLDEFQARRPALAFLTVDLPDPGAFGRVVRDAHGAVAAIVEAKDYDPAVHGPLGGEINSGIYAQDMAAVGPLLPRQGNANASGEFYITDLVALAVQAGLPVLGVRGGADPQLLGVNSPAELARAEELLRASIVDGLLDAGVMVHQPGTAVVGPRAVLEPGCEISGPCEIHGATRIAAGASVGSHCWIRDAEIGPGALVRPFCHIEGASVGPDCQIGPFARLRPQAVTEQGARVGNFVEMKKARLGPGAKASHLTYLGDAQVGAGANIGAGTITCNYDGRSKHETVIGEGAFIGSNTALVAPVRIGDRALVGAGSVITRDVGDDMLALERSRQRELPRRK
jgi:bifunctional UDP-N-acetylglucosamine pyrophosphorylase/glucosamine-1-phosphate N-acetyltransferase